MFIRFYSRVTKNNDAFRPLLYLFQSCLFVIFFRAFTLFKQFGGANVNGELLKCDFASVGVRLCIVCRPVINLFSLPAAHNQAAAAEGAQMMGNGRAGHLHQRGNIDDTLFCMAQKPKDSKSCGIAELLEQIRNCLKSLRLVQSGFNMLQVGLLAMDMRQRRIFHGIFSFFAHSEILFARLAGSIADALTPVSVGIILQAQRLSNDLIVKRILKGVFPYEKDL